MKNKLLVVILFVLPAIFAALFLSSCAALQSAFTGEPIPVTPVAREGGIPFNVATSDVLRAEASPPGTAWGLYNAGAAAARTREIVEVGK